MKRALKDTEVGDLIKVMSLKDDGIGIFLITEQLESLKQQFRAKRIAGSSKSFVDSFILDCEGASQLQKSNYVELL